MRTTLSNDQRGVAHLALILVAVIVLAGVGFAGYRVMNKDKANNNKNLSASQIEANNKAEKDCMAAVKDKDFCAFAANMSFEKLSYELTIKATSESGSGTSTVSSDGKGNTKAVFSGEGSSLESVYLDGVTYIKDPSDGSWLKYPKNDPNAPNNQDLLKDADIDKSFKDEASGKTTYKRIGKEKCGNLNCLKYQIIDKATPNATTYVWFNPDDNRMYRFSGKDENGDYDMSIVYKTVKISAPSPVKDASAAAPTGGLSSEEAQTLQ